MKTKLLVMLFVLVAVVMVFASCGHECDYSVVVEEVAATCTTNGYKTTQCSQCELTKTEALTAIGHAYVETVVEPTCKAGGYTTKTCSNCNDTQTGLNPTNKLNTHDFKELENTRVEPTCTTDGYESKLQCSVCEATRNGTVIPATGHKYETTTTYTLQATCTEAGKGDIVSKCTVAGCGAFNPDVAPVYGKEIPALGHDLPAAPAVTPATCLTAQINTWTCQREGCEYSKVEQDANNPALNHDYTVKADVIIPATCYSLETANFKCVRCEEKVPQQIPNSYVEHTAGAAADCDTPQTCTVCVAAGKAEANAVGGDKGCDITNNKCIACVKAGKTHVFAVPTEAHVYDITNPVAGSTVAPTCMQKGYSMYLCTGCNKQYKDNYTDIDPDNHDYDFENKVGDTTTPATCIKFEFGTHRCKHQDLEGNRCEATIEKVVGDTYAAHTFSAGTPTGVITCAYCQKNYYDTTYVENKYTDSEGTEWDNKDVVFDEGEDEDGNPVDVTLGVTITTSTNVDDPVVLNSTTPSATVVDAVNTDTTFITVIRFVTAENSTTKYKVTVNGEKTYEITGNGYVDLHDYLDGDDLKSTDDDVAITSLVVEIVDGSDETTVYFYGEDAVPAPVA